MKESHTPPSAEDDFKFLVNHTRMLSNPESDYIAVRERLFHHCCPFSAFVDYFPLQADLIIPSLYISDLYTATSPTVLSELGITHVLCIHDDILSDYPTERTLDILFIQLEDIPSANVEDFFASSTAWIQDALADADSKVLVHCIAGRSRSPTLVIAYLMATKGWSFSTAVTYVQHRRAEIDPSVSFVNQLRRLESRLHDPGYARNVPVERQGVMIKNSQM